MRGKDLPLKITEFLKDGPASINDVCKELKISWATAKSCLEDMKEKNNIKEIVSNPKIKIFRLANDPAFYGIPLSKEQKGQALFLFQSIRQEWQKTGKKPLLATILQKIAVDVAKECNCGIPFARFHYGMIVPIFETHSFSIQAPENASWIINAVRKHIPLHKNNARDEMNGQYEKYSMVLYKSKERLKSAILKLNEDSSLEEVKLSLSSLLMSVPTSDDDSELFSLFSEFVKEAHGLILAKSFLNNIDEVKESFDALWDLATTSLFFKDMEKSIKPEKKEIYEHIKSSQISAKRANVEERIGYLRSLIDAELEIKLPADEESVEIRRILVEGAEEG